MLIIQAPANMKNNMRINHVRIEIVTFNVYCLLRTVFLYLNKVAFATSEEVTIDAK